MLKSQTACKHPSPDFLPEITWNRRNLSPGDKEQVKDDKADRDV